MGLTKTRPIPKVNTAPLMKQDILDYTKGLNTYLANDVVPDNQLVVGMNNRFSTLGRLKTRRGWDFYSTPAGETLDTQQTSVTGAADQDAGLTTWKAAKWVAGSSGRLTRLDLNLKNSAAATGPVYVVFYSDSAGSPGTVLGQGSITSSTIISSYAYCTARFIDAPQVVNGTTYWVVAYVQNDGTGLYKWSSTTTATTSLTSANSGTTWSSTTYALNVKGYVATNAPTLGLFRAYKSDGTKSSLLANNTTLYTVNDGTGVLTSIKGSLSASATDYYFQVANDTVFYVNGQDAPRKWDFTTESAVAGSPAIARDIILHKNQMFYVDKTDPAKLYWSDIGSFESFTSTNFLYVPSPKSADPIVGLVVFNDNLYIFTRKTKWVLYGADSTSFVLRKATGLKGAVHKETIKATRSHIYFLSDDGIYRFNGGIDEVISEDITNDVRGIADKTKCSAGIANNRYYLYYPPSGSGTSTQCFVFNINYQSWESFDTSTYVSRTSLWDGAGDTSQFLVGSNLVGAAYYSEQDTNNYDLMGKTINWEVRTHYHFYKNPANKKRIKRWYPRFASQTGNYSVSCQYDKDFANTPSTTLVNVQGSGNTWGGGGIWGNGLLWGTTALTAPRINVPSTEKYVQYRYLRTGVNNPIEFLGHTWEFEVRRAH